MARIKTYYFSPTGGTLQMVRHLAETLGRLLHAEVEYHSYIFADDWDMPDGAKLPLWMLGFLY